jgi:hypothetical protein
MTKEEEMKLRELAAGRCTLPSVTEALGPLSLWSKDGLDREIRKAVEAERERLAKVFDELDKDIGWYDPHEPAEIIRGQA